MIKQLEARVGIHWAARAVALLFLVLLGLANVVLRAPSTGRERKMPRSLVDSTAFSDWPYLLLILGAFTTFLGLYTPFVYIQSYSLDEKLVPSSLVFYMVAILNSSSIFGRILPLLLAQRLGPMNMLIFAIAGLAITSLCLITTSSTPRLIIAIIIYGFWTGTMFALLPTAVVRLTADKYRVGTRFGMGFAVYAFAFLFGPPIAGALLRRFGYHAAWIWAGVAMLVGAIIISLARMQKATWHLRSRV